MIYLLMHLDYGDSIALVLSIMANLKGVDPPYIPRVLSVPSMHPFQSLSSFENKSAI